MLRTALLLLLLPLISASTTIAEIKVEKTEYEGWQKCYRVSNGEVELIVTGDVGPRVIRFGFVGGQNLFKEFPEQLGRAGEDKISIARRRSGLEGAGRSGGNLGPGQCSGRNYSHSNWFGRPGACGAAYHAAEGDRD